MSLRTERAFWIVCLVCFAAYAGFQHRLRAQLEDGLAEVRGELTDVVALRDAVTADLDRLTRIDSMALQLAADCEERWEVLRVEIELAEEADTD